VPTVDRSRWNDQRLQFLQGLLEQGVSDEQRTAIECEMEALRKEAGHRWLRRLFGLPRRAL